MANEIGVQQVIHKLEEGGWARWVWLAVLAGAVCYVGYAWMFKESGFKGLAHPRAFEQAVMAREIARGHGFSTLIVRPAELWLFRDHDRPFAADHIPDTYQAPLWPTVLAPFLLTVQKTWPMTERDVQYTSDRVIVAVGLGFFLLAVAVNFFVARRLFDQRLAVFGVGLMLLCDEFWRFSMSGLPQMLMLFLFSLALYALVRLLETYQVERMYREEDERLAQHRGSLASPAGGPPESTEKALPRQDGLPAFAPEEDRPPRYALPAWSAAAGAALGLLTLTHAMALWVLAGALLFALTCLVGARRRTALPMLLVCLLFYAPWLVRNFEVCGSPGGVAWYSVLSQVRGTESLIMRSKESPVKGATPTMFRQKMQAQITAQLGNLTRYFGYVMLAPVFFISLLHLFKRRSTAVFRWCVLCMWGSAMLGMAVFGLDEQVMQANDLHVLFIPILSFYGLAYVLVLWSRLEVNVRLVRIAFMTMLYFACGWPFLLTFLSLHLPANSRVEWPPYVPPYIAILGTWTTDREIIMSDMPWAVAWYANRRSLWLTTNVHEFNELNDYKLLNAPIVGLYLTPITGDQPFLSGIVKGDYREWSPFILRSGIPRNFALHSVTVLPENNECTFYADRDRWTLHED